MYQVDFVSATHGYAVGDAGTILATTNGGSTWTAQTSGSTAALLSVHFVSATTGWAVGSSGTILKTTNGGTTWTAQTSGTTGTLNTVYFVSPTRGWAAGSSTSGNILSTTDGGATWTMQAAGTINSISSLSFSSGGHGVAVGYDGTVLWYNDPTFVNTIAVESTPNCSIYPNPTSGQLTLALDQQEGAVSVTISNIMGQTLSSQTYNNQRQIGLMLEGPAGMYLISIQNEQGESTTLKVVKE